MRLYTRPRLLIVALLRPGDHLATNIETGHLINTEAAYVDTDLSDKVRWTVIHSAAVRENSSPPRYTVRHTFGELTTRGSDHVIIREMLEVDPWLYIERADRGPGGPRR